MIPMTLRGTKTPNPPPPHKSAFPYYLIYVLSSNSIRTNGKVNSHFHHQPSRTLPKATVPEISPHKETPNLNSLWTNQQRQTPRQEGRTTSERLRVVPRVGYRILGARLAEPRWAA